MNIGKPIVDDSEDDNDVKVTIQEISSSNSGKILMHHMKCTSYGFCDFIDHDYLVYGCRKCSIEGYKTNDPIIIEVNSPKLDESIWNKPDDLEYEFPELHNLDI